MRRQPALEIEREFDFTPPRTHTGDPATSHIAEARSRKTWSRKHRNLVDHLRATPGMTASDITHLFKSCVWWPADFHARLCDVRKRLSDLKNGSPPKIRRQCVKGESESRWFLA